MAQEPWYIRLGIYWIFAIGALLGLSLTALLALILHWQPGLLAILGITLGSGIASSAAVLTWICLTPPRIPPEREFPSPVPLQEFLDDPEAVIAPNLHPDACDRLAQWLKNFAAHHGDHSVWILPLPDGPAADRILLAISSLSSSDLVALEKFDFDTIEELSEETRAMRYPRIGPSKKLIELFWD
jgi:hypothetical protein